MNRSASALLMASVFALGVGIGCTDEGSGTENVAACSAAVALLDGMVEAGQFQQSELLADLNAELGTIEGSAEVADAVQKVHATTTDWIMVMGDPLEGDERRFNARDDLLEARLALRRTCR